jgi:hypothetical protein
LKVLFELRYRHTRFVPWAAVKAITEARIHIDRPASALKQVEEL